MTTFERPLAGCMVNVSISESEDSSGRGFPPWQVNRVVLQVSSALLGQGAGIVFGHDWREDGVMEAVFGFARQVQPPVPVEPAEGEDHPLMLNVLPWPDDPYLPARNLEGLRSTLRVVSAGLPDGLRGLDEQGRLEGRGGHLYGYLRARGLTHLRHRLNTLCHARICLGGRRGGSQGRFPGVIEEAYLAVCEGKPLYVAGLLGGASAQVVAAIEGAAMPEDFCAPDRMPARDLYAHPPVSEPIESADDRMVERERVWHAFAKIGLAGISRANTLTVAQNEELFHTPALDRVVEIVVSSLSRIHSRS